MVNLGSTEVEESLSDAISEAKGRNLDVDTSDKSEEDLKKEIRRLSDRLRELEEAHKEGKILVEEDDYSDLEEHKLEKRMKEIEISQDVMESQLENELEKFQEEMVEDFFSLVKSHTSKNRLEDKVDEIRSDADQRLEDLEEEVKNVEVEEKADKSELYRELNNTKGNLEAKIEDKHDSTLEEVNDIREDIESIRSHISSLEGRVDAMQERMADAEAETSRIESEFDSKIGAAKEQVREEIEPVPSQDEFEGLKDNVREISELLEQLSDRLIGRE